MHRRVLTPLLLAATLLLTTGPATDAPPTADAPGRAVTALWQQPVEGVVTRAFDPPPDRFGAGHRGADLAGAPGGAVVAAGDGVVAFAGMVAGRPVVSVDHPGGLRTTYEPVTPTVGAG